MFGALTRQHRGRELFPLYVEVILYGVIFTGTAKAYSVCQFNLCPAWGRLREALEDPAYQAFQSTPPHGGRLIASLSRNATYEKRVRQDMKKKAELAFEQMEVELMAAIKQHPELVGELHDVLTRAREKVLTDGD